jgi:membrane protease YdiL (CAAX protease family)
MSELSAEVYCPACAAWMRPALATNGPFCTSCGTGLRPSDLAPVLPLDLDDGDLSAYPAGYESSPPPSPPQPHPNFGFAVLWCLGIVFAVTILPGAIGGFFAVQAAGVRNPQDAAALMESPEFGKAMMPWMAFGQVLSISIACLVISRVASPGTARQIGMRLPSGYHLILSILALPAIMVVATGVDGLAKLVLPRLFDVDGSMAMMAAWPWYIGVLLVGLGPGIGEELWFRAFIGRGLVARHGVAGGVLLTSLLFGLVHLDPRHAIVAMTMGIALHLIYLATGSLWVPILLHTLNNTVAILTIGGGGQRFVDATAAEVPWTVYVATVGMLGAIGWGLYRTRVRASEGPRLDLYSRPAPAEAAAATADSTAQESVRPDIVAWVLPLAAACLFVAFAIRGSVEYERRMAPFYPEVPNRDAVLAMLAQEPISVSTWPAWSKRLREWLPDKGNQLDPAFDKARDFLAQEFARGDPRPPLRDDPMAWYLQGRGMLRNTNDPLGGAARGRLAEPILRRSIELDPSIGRAHYALAVALYLQATPANAKHPKFAEARREAAEGERLDPTTSAKAAEAFSAMIHGRYDLAERLYEEIVDERPHDKSWRNALSNAREAQLRNANRRRR